MTDNNNNNDDDDDDDDDDENDNKFSDPLFTVFSLNLNQPFLFCKGSRFRPMSVVVLIRYDLLWL